ncbi:MAG: ankyrin repeat domain-containing protein, partial [Planctomycetaceae bacterium]
LAARKDELAITRLLLEKGADVNARDDDGKTPLASTVNANMQDMLIRAGGKK